MPTFPTVIPDAIDKQDQQGQLQSYFASQPPLGQDVGQQALRDYMDSQPPLEDSVKDILQPPTDTSAALTPTPSGGTSLPPDTSTSPSGYNDMAGAGGGSSTTSSVIDAVRAKVKPENQSFVDYAVQTATKNGIDPEVFARQLAQESNFDPTVTGSSGEKNIGQQLPSEAQALGIDPNNPWQSIDGAARQMAGYLAQYGGDYQKALAAYNGGQGNLANLGIDRMLSPSFAGGMTQGYVGGVLAGTQQAPGVVQGKANALRTLAQMAASPNQPLNVDATAGDTIKGVMQGPSPDSTPPTPSVPDDAISRGIAQADQSLVGMARQAAQEAGIDPTTFLRQIYQESGFNPNAQNPSGASGIAQLMPQYYRSVNAFDPKQALTAAAQTMAGHLADYGGDWSKALAAYNAGAGNLAHYGLQELLSDDFASGQTKRYVANILGASGSPPGPAAAPLAAPPTSGAAVGAPSSSVSPPTGTSPTGIPPTSPSSSGSLQDHLNTLGQQFSDTVSQLFGGTTAPSYNDMAGGSSRYTDTNPPSEGLAGLDLATSPQGPTDGTTLGQVPLNILNAGINQVNQTEQNLENTPPYSPEAVNNVGNMVLGVTGGEGVGSVLGKVLGPLGYEDAPNILRSIFGGAPAAGDLGNVAQGLVGGERPTIQAAETAVPGSFAGNAVYQADRNLAAATRAYDEALQSGNEALIDQRAADYTQAQTARELAQSTYYPPKRYQGQPLFPTGPLANIGRGAIGGGLSGAIGGGISASQQPGATPLSVGVGGLEGFGTGAVTGGLSAATREALPAGAAGQVSRTLQSVIQGTQPAEREGFAGNIRLEKLPEDVQSIVQDAYNKAPQLFEDARRGVISDATVQQLANQAGTTVQKVIDRWKPGQAQNAETINAMRAALSAKSDEVIALNQRISGGDTSPAALLQFNAAVREQQAVQQAVSGVTAEAGRGLRALRANVTSAVQTGDPGQMQKLLAKMGGVEWTQELSDRLAKLAPDDIAGRAQFVRDAFNPQLKDYLTELWYNAMLSGPHTFAVKTTSETLSLALATPERFASALTENVLARAQGRPQERYIGEAPALAVGMVGGLREGANKFLYTIQHGFSESQAAGLDYLRPRAFKGPVGAAINFPSNLLAAGVEFTSHVAAAGELNALAYRNAVMKGLSGDALTNEIANLRSNPTPEMLAAAHKTGLYRAFQQPAPKGGPMAAILQARNANWNGIPVGRILVPFFQTPVNLAKMGMERSPMAALNLGMWRDFAQRNPNASDGIGRWVLGSGIAAALALEIKAGNITGAAPTVPAEADAWRREGKIPWAFRVGNNWVSYQHLTPLSQSIGQVATIVNGVERGEDVSQIAGETAMTIGAQIVQEPYMQSISSVLQGINDPSKYGQRFLQGLASSAVPAAVRIGAQIQDPTVRQVTNPLEAMQVDIPGLSQQLPPRLNAFGEPQQRLTSNVSPIGVSQATNDPIDAELSRLHVEPGFTGKTLRGIQLTRNETAMHQQFAGYYVKQELGRILNDPRYEAANDLDRAKALQDAIRLGKDEGAQMFLRYLYQRQGPSVLQRVGLKPRAAVTTLGASP